MGEGRKQPGVSLLVIQLSAGMCQRTALTLQKPVPPRDPSCQRLLRSWFRKELLWTSELLLVRPVEDPRRDPAGETAPRDGRNWPRYPNWKKYWTAWTCVRSFYGGPCPIQ